MKRGKLVAALALASVILTSGSIAMAGQFGTAGEAKAMLERAADALSVDKAGALDQFTKGEAGFMDRDLYVFCAGPDGKITAHPTLAIGTDVRSLKDVNGMALGEEMLDVATDAEMHQLSYMWPRPGSTDPVQKTSFVQLIGDQVCGVGYYE